VSLTQCDAIDYIAPQPLDGALFSLSYNTMPHHRFVLTRTLEQVRPGARIVVMPIFYSSRGST
jgi:hypothetical protein